MSGYWKYVIQFASAQQRCKIKVKLISGVTYFHQDLHFFQFICHPVIGSWQFQAQAYLRLRFNLL